MCNLQGYLNGLTPARDRRLKTRITPKSLVYVRFGDTDGIVVNVSETGMALAAGGLPAVGDYPIRIRLQLPTSSQSIGISAHIVRVTKSKKGVGVRLVDLSADASAEIANWIASEESAAELGQAAQLLHRNEQPLEIGSRKSKRIFSDPSAPDEEAAARYAEMFPSESTYAKHHTAVDENKPQQDPIPISVRSKTDTGDSMLRSAAKISTGDVPQTLRLPQVQIPSELAAPSASHTPIAGFGSQARTDEVKSSADRAGNSPLHSYIFDLSGLQVAALVFLFAVIGLIIGIAATKASVDVLASLGGGPFGKQVRLRSQSAHTQSASGPLSDSAPSVTSTETSSARTSRSPVDLDSSAGANTVGSSPPPEEKAKEGARDSEPSVEAPSTGSNPSTTAVPKPSADPEERSNRNNSTGIIARSAPPPASAEHAHSAVTAGPIRSAPRNRALITTKPATAAAPKSSAPTLSLKHTDPAVAAGPIRSAPRNRAFLTTKPAMAAAPKSSPPTASLKHAYPAVAVSPNHSAPRNRALPTAKPTSGTPPKPSSPTASSKRSHPAVAGGPKGTDATHTAKPAAPAAPAPSPQPANPNPKNPTVAEGPKGDAPGNPNPPTAKPAASAAPNPPPSANSEPANPVVAEGPKDGAPGSPAPLTAKPPAAAEPKLPTPSSVVTVPFKGGKPVKVIFPQKQIAFSSSLAITTQLSVVVPPESGPATAQPSRLQAGKLVSYVLPRNPRAEDRYGAEETVKVRATIGQQGLVTEIRPVSGPIFLLSSTMSAVRLWRYKPTLLNGTPIETHQDVTIIFKVAR